MRTPILARRIAERLPFQITRAQILDVLTVYSEILMEVAESHIDEEDHEVPLGKIGRFKIRNAPPRRARNPMTGETVQVPARRKLVWHPYAATKARLSGASRRSG